MSNIKLSYVESVNPDICNKLSIGINYKDTGKNKSKKDMYEEIIQYF